MNLEDYAYEENDRWYVNPQVALDEQNAFINNLRNLQAQDNAQITQQIRGLGAQVPSQLGGLVGGGGYFRSRYQTPQTNQLVASLKTLAQKQALQMALNNELEKAKKQYSDAENVLPSTNKDPLQIENAGGEGEKYQTRYKETVNNEGGPGTISKQINITPELIQKDRENLGVTATDSEGLIKELMAKGYSESEAIEIATYLLGGK